MKDPAEPAHAVPMPYDINSRLEFPNIPGEMEEEDFGRRGERLAEYRRGVLSGLRQTLHGLPKSLQGGLIAIPDLLVPQVQTLGDFAEIQALE